MAPKRVEARESEASDAREEERCVPFEPEREVFDDEAVRACLRHHELITAETHFFTQQGRAYWLSFIKSKHDTL